MTRNRRRGREERHATSDRRPAVALTEEAEGVETEQRIQFRPSVPLPHNLLESLPEVGNVIHRGDVVVVTGNSSALNAVTSALARNQIVARQLRVDQANLEDAGWAVAFGLAAARFFRRE